LEVAADDPLTVQLYLCLAVLFEFSVPNTNYSVECIFKISKKGHIQNALNLQENLKLQECNA